MARQGARTVGCVVLALVVVLVVAGLAWIPWASTRGQSSEAMVSDLVGQPQVYDGAAVRMNLAYGKRSPDDPAAELISRSDCHLHDETGSILLFGGWQVWSRWQDDGVFRSDWLDVSEAGVWTVKKAVVHYDELGLPYLTPPGEDTGG